MARRLCLLVVALLAWTTSAGAVSRDDPAYERANALLARSIPPYPRARLLVEETVGGEADAAKFEAVQRIYFLARPTGQRAAIAFYRTRLGPAWRRAGPVCLASGSRLLVALVDPRRRRIGVLIDSRGARRCRALAGLIGDLLDVGYPNP
jgi:hypothetical protein